MTGRLTAGPIGQVAVYLLLLLICPRPLWAQSSASDAAAEPFVPLDQKKSLSVFDNAVPSSLLGRPIVAIEVSLRGDRWKAPVTVREVKIGEAFSPEAVRRALREVDAAGVFAGLAAEVVPREQGLLLRIVATPARRVMSVQIEGGLLPTNTTLSAAGLGQNIQVTQADLDGVPARIRQLYDRGGFPQAAVTVQAVDLDVPGSVMLAVRIDPGSPRLLTQRVFVIEPEWDKHVGDLKADYEVEAGDRLDVAACEEADRKLAQLLREQGFIKARVYHKILQRGAQSFLYVYVDSGPRLEVGFEGQRSFDHDQLLRQLKIEKGDIAGADDLASRTRRHYVSHGFLDATVRWEERKGPEAGVLHVVLIIREGVRVRVTNRIFLCLPAQEDPDDVGRELDRVLEEELPNEPLLSVPGPGFVDHTFGSVGSTKPEPMTLTPASVYTPEAYAAALKRVSELYLGQGYLSSIVGPALVVRARCRDDSPAGQCVEQPLPQLRAACRSDEFGHPIPEAPVVPGVTCTPDDEQHQRCSPNITLRIPLHLGPRTNAYDLRFSGNRELTDQQLAVLAKLETGKPLSYKAVEDAKARIKAHYEDLGFAFVELRSEITRSPDASRAEIRISVIERDQVVIDGIDVEGASRTDHELIRRRVTLTNGSLYSRSALRLSEERIATLGPFSSVSVSLAEPEVPRKTKRLVVRVVEYSSQYVEPRVGFSTGEGLRLGVEYGHRNIGGLAVALTLRLELSYLFDFMIIDSDVEDNLGPLPASQRLERRNSVRVSFPEIGLGPLVSLGIEGIDVRDNQRDFGLTREAIVPTLFYRPLREITTSLAASIELNDVQIFNAESVEDAIRQNRALERLLRFPDGTTFAVSQRVGVSWDRRDNPLAATSGFLLSGHTEHVNAFPASPNDPDTSPLVSHFLKVTSRFATYFKLSEGGISLAISVAGGLNIQLASDSRTYPDRLFFLGGFDSIRSFLADSVVPEDVAQQILNPADGTEALSIDDVAVRGGDVVVNPRVELRFPIAGAFGLGVFLDLANLWVDPLAFDPLAWRYGAGAGLRFATPLGPLALDYGFNLDRRPWEDLGALHFSVGLF